MLRDGANEKERLQELSPASDLSSAFGFDDLVSVIIPAYNAAPFIKETLESVFVQTYPCYQVIVVNDGSPDTEALEQVLQPYMHRIRYFKQENAGPSAARNKGLHAAEGSLVAFLDADDLWTPDYLEVQAKFLHEHPEYDLVYCNALFFGDSIHAGTEYMQLCRSEGEATAAAIIARRCHVFTSVMARKDKFILVGYDETIRASEDFDCWIRFAAAGYRIGYHRQVLVHYRKHTTSASANSTRMAEYNIQVLTNALCLWPGDCEERSLLIQAKAQRVAGLELVRAKLALQSHDIPTAITHLEAANDYFKSPKTYAVLALLKLAPGLVTSIFRLRRSFFRAYREI